MPSALWLLSLCAQANPPPSHITAGISFVQDPKHQHQKLRDRRYSMLTVPLIKDVRFCKSNYLWHGSFCPFVGPLFSLSLSSGSVEVLLLKVVPISRGVC